MKNSVRFDCGPLLTLLGNYTVGLTLPDGQGHFKYIGSGTLVEIGDSQGILTAQHVLDVIPRRGETKIGLFRDRDDGDFVSLKLEDTRRFGLMDPDIAYLELPPDVVSTLRRMKSFKPLISDIVTTSDLPRVVMLLGAPDQWTTNENLNNQKQRRRFYLLGTVCDVVDKREVGDHDVVTVKPKLGEGITEPATYGGVSGGGVWLTFISKDGKNDVDRRLIGLACRQVHRAGEPTLIECCGPDTLYNRFLPALRSALNLER